jgi:hypothetical protein
LQTKLSKIIVASLRPSAGHTCLAKKLNPKQHVTGHSAWKMADQGQQASQFLARRLPMHKIFVVMALALMLAGCETARQDRMLGGALIGGGTGALIGGLAGRTGGAAVAGGLIGAGAGAIIADATRPGRCYYWRNHRRHYVPCR